MVYTALKKCISCKKKEEKIVKFNVTYREEYHKLNYRETNKVQNIILFYKFKNNNKFYRGIIFCRFYLSCMEIVSDII